MSDSPVFVITGASSGIGAATARHAAQAGHRVVLAARSADKIEALAAEIGGLAVTTDVTRWEDNEALMRRALDEYGGSTPSSPTPASAARAAGSRASPRSGARWC